MGRAVPSRDNRPVERMLAQPANRSRATAQQQQGAISGQVPGTSSPYNQTGVQYGVLQPGSSGDQVAAVGHMVPANDGSPVVFMGNLSISGDSGYPPEGFQDGGFVFVDADGNAVAGYSHPTGPWGFWAGGPEPASFYYFGALQLFESIPNPMSLGPTGLPQQIFPSGISYGNSLPASGAYVNAYGWWQGGTGNTTSPVCLFYNGPTEPPATEEYPALFLVARDGNTVIASGGATVESWTFNGHGYECWISCDSGGTNSTLDWSWSTTPTGALSINSDGSFSVSGSDIIDVWMQAYWFGAMS